MTKDEFAEHLRSRGYSAGVEENCVKVFVPDITKKVQRDITRIVKEAGYEGSYGWKVVNRDDKQEH